MHHDSPDGHGVWMDDTRYLSDYKVLVNGVEAKPTRDNFAEASLCLALESAARESSRHAGRLVPVAVSA